MRRLLGDMQSVRGKKLVFGYAKNWVSEATNKLNPFHELLFWELDSGHVGCWRYHRRMPWLHSCCTAHSCGWILHQKENKKQNKIEYIMQIRHCQERMWGSKRCCLEVWRWSDNSVRPETWFLYTKVSWYLRVNHRISDRLISTLHGCIIREKRECEEESKPQRQVALFT